MSAALELLSLPVSVVSIAMVAGSAFTKKPQAPKATAVGVGLAAGTAVVASGWAVHPVAALVMAAWSSLLWSDWSRHHRQLIVLLVSAVVLAACGAGWVLVPMGIVTAIALFSGGMLQDPSMIKRRWNGLPARDAGRGPVPYGAEPMRPPGAADAARTHGFGGPGFEPPPPPAALQSLAADPRLTPGTRNRILWIEYRCEEVLHHPRTEPIDPAKLHSVEQIQRDYAPQAVRTYLALPRDLADARVVADDKTGRELLDDQLDLMLRALDKIRDEATLHGAQTLLAQQRFLQQKFPEPGPDDQLHL